MNGVLDQGKRPSLLVAVVLAVVLIGGPVAGASRGAEGPPRGAEPPAAEPECVEPHPCDYEWEGAALGPFELDRVEQVEVEVETHDDDGTKLRGWLAFPDLPEGITAPVALHSSPYNGWCFALVRGCVPGPGNPAFWDDDPGPGVVRTWGVAPIELVRRGYVAAYFDVRGTGGSGGCLDWGSRDEQEDQKVLVDWLAGQPWSNGRVGMGGNSYPGGTAWHAAALAPEGLKTIVTAGVSTDWYLYFHTPQGMHHVMYPTAQTGLEIHTAWLPHAAADANPAGDVPRIAKRAVNCEPFRTSTESTAGAFLRDRDADFWEPRRPIQRFDQVQASVLLPHGLRDVTGMAFQDMLVWEALHGTGQAGGPGRRPSGLTCPPHAPFCADAPKSPPTWQVSGQWGHGPPFSEQPSLTPEWIRDNWSTILFDWLGYWLQGVGETPPHRVDYQDTSGAWHTSSAWPPAEAHEEALYLDGDRLTTTPGEDDRRFRAAPAPGNNHAWSMEAGAPLPPAAWTWCRQALAPGVPDTAVAYVSKPFEEDSLLAGNPFAYLELSSDQLGGELNVSLVRWPADASCTDPRPQGEHVARGGADLRYHQGGYRAQPFPVATPTPVRVDLWNAAARFAPGDRLVVVVSGTETPADLLTGQYSSVSPYQPQIDVHARLSHVVLPFVSGGLGGQPTGIDYPPNPAAPGVPRE